MSNINRIFIIGHIGAGKALLAKALADKLAWKFIDPYLGLEGLERNIGRTLSDLVGKQHEETLLQYQLDLLLRHHDQENAVITTDATMILSPKIKDLLSSEYVIYLKVGTQTQLDRMSDSDPPALPLLSTPEKKTFLDQLHADRDHLLEEIADLTVESKSVEEDINSILHALKKQ